MGKATDVLGGMMSDRQLAGVSYLYKEIPRSFKLLLLLFVTLYAAYWGLISLEAPHALSTAIYSILGLLMATSLVISLVKLWPRMETALPRWFRAEVEAPALHPYWTFLAWGGMLALVIAASFATTEIVFAVLMVTGIVGGILILYLVETYVLKVVDRVQSSLRRVSLRGGWGAFLLLFASLLVLLMAQVVLGLLTVANTNIETSKLDIPSTFLTIILGMLVAVQFGVLSFFVLLMLYRGWVKRRIARNVEYGPRRRALVKANPLAMAIYLEMMNLITTFYLAVHIFLLVVQAVAMAQQKGAVTPFQQWNLLPGPLLDYAAFISILVAGLIILLNLSGSAVGRERWYFNRNNFASMSIVIVMALLLQIVAARGEELMVSLLFRVFYLLGIMLAPLFVFLGRWNHMGKREARFQGVATPPVITSLDRPDSSERPSP